MTPRGALYGFNAAAALNGPALLCSRGISRKAENRRYAIGYTTRYTTRTAASTAIQRFQGLKRKEPYRHRARKALFSVGFVGIDRYPPLSGNHLLAEGVRFELTEL